MNTSDFITVVSGLPRSGTSLMMQMLNAGGVPALTDNLRRPDQNNPRGYFEFEPVKRLRSDHSWLVEAKGRVVKIIHLLLRDLPIDGRFEYRVVMMKRPIYETLASQRVMLEREGKKSADPAMLEQVYQTQLSQVEEWLAAQPCFKTLPIEYHDVIAGPREAAERVAEFLGGGLDLEAMSASVDPTLHRQRAGLDPGR